MAVRRPLVEIGGEVTELPLADSLPTVPVVPLAPYRIDLGDTLVIAEGFSLTVCGPFELIGTLDLDGRICL